MVYGDKAGCSADTGIWWCPTPGCDGAGFGFDVVAVAVDDRMEKSA
jgi:hypothetical protein